MVEDTSLKRPLAAGESGRGTMAGEPPQKKQAQLAAFKNAFECKLAATLSLHEGARSVTFLRFSADGKQLASSSTDGTISIWDPQEGKLLRRFGKDTAGPLGGHEKGICCVSWSPDGALICTASDDQTLRLWHSQTGKCLKVLTGHTHFVMCCEFSCR